MLAGEINWPRCKRRWRDFLGEIRQLNIQSSSDTLVPYIPILKTKQEIIFLSLFSYLQPGCDPNTSGFSCSSHQTCFYLTRSEIHHILNKVHCTTFLLCFTHDCLSKLAVAAAVGKTCFEERLAQRSSLITRPNKLEPSNYIPPL